MVRLIHGLNVHTLTHLVENVKLNGPMWTTSTFPFENAIYFLKQNVHSPKGVYEQMAKKTLQGSVFKSIVQESTEISPCTMYCNSLFVRNEVVNFNRSIDREVVFIGKGKKDSKYSSLSKNGEEVLTFDRCILRSMIVHSVRYECPQKSDDTIFRLCNGQFIQVLNLLHIEQESLAGVQYLKVDHLVFTCSDIGSTCEKCNLIDFDSKNIMRVIKTISGVKIIPLLNISEKCIVMKVHKNIYISTLPNTIEIQ